MKLASDIHMSLLIKVTFTILFSLLCFQAEEGELYVFYGGSSFPSGNATRGCRKIDPCPGEKVK